MIGEVIQGLVGVILLIVGVKRSQQKQYEEAKQGQLKKFSVANRSHFGMLAASQIMERASVLRCSI